VFFRFSKNLLFPYNRALNFIALFVFLPQMIFTQFVELESRGLWIVRESMVTTEKIDSALMYAYKSDYDKVFVQVRGRGDAFYNSKIVAKHQSIAEDFDPLSYVIELGHSLGLEIHAWMNSYILWSGNLPPDNEKHIYLRHPEWTEANHHSKMDWRIDLKAPQSHQWEGIYLAPTHPEVNQYLLSVYSEVIQNYDIDGIHLDYIRYQDYFYGYNPEGRDLFDGIYGIDPLDIARGIISTRFGWEESFVDSMHNAWNQYRIDKVTELVSLIKSDIDSSGKNISLSAAVKPNILKAQNRWFQDWHFWLQSSIVDFVIPMNYYKEIKYFNQDIQLMKTYLSQAELDKVVMGIATYNQDAQAAADKVLLTRLNGFNGVCVFSYDSHKNNLDWFIPVLDALGHSFGE